MRASGALLLAQTQHVVDAQNGDGGLCCEAQLLLLTHRGLEYTRGACVPQFTYKFEDAGNQKKEADEAEYFDVYEYTRMY